MCCVNLTNDIALENIIQCIMIQPVPKTAIT